MKSKIHSIVISLSFLLIFALIVAVEIQQPAFENALALQEDNSSMYPNMSSLEEDRIYPNMSSLEEDRIYPNMSSLEEDRIYPNMSSLNNTK
jgi:hypothetical protein